MSYSRIHHRITIPPQKIDHSPPPGGASPGIAHSLVTVTMPVHRSRCPAAFPHAARFFSTLHRTRLAAHSRPRPCYRFLLSAVPAPRPLPPPRAFWLRYPGLSARSSYKPLGIAVEYGLARHAHDRPVARPPQIPESTRPGFVAPWLLSVVSLCVSRCPMECSRCPWNVALTFSLHLSGLCCVPPAAD
jgi:hypothetical protein